MTCPPWLIPAFDTLDEREIAGRLSNPRISEMHAAIDGRQLPDEIAWCSAFAAWCFQESGLHVPKRVTRLARSWLTADELDPLELPALGAVAVFKRGSEAWQGHVGFVLGSRPGLIMLIGGNQQNAVSVAPYPTAALLGLRWPKAFARRRALP